MALCSEVESICTTLEEKRFHFYENQFLFSVIVSNSRTLKYNIYSWLFYYTECRTKSVAAYTVRIGLQVSGKNYVLIYWRESMMLLMAGLRNHLDKKNLDSQMQTWEILSHNVRKTGINTHMHPRDIKIYYSSLT